MFFGFTQRKPLPPLSRKRSLDGVPLLVPGLNQEMTPAGTLALTVRWRRGKGWLARFQPAIMERRVKLDEIGTFVFQQIDGKRSTRDIIGILATRYKLNRRDAELSVVEFLKVLARRHVIAVAIK